jgi:hypothetical protein
MVVTELGVKRVRLFLTKKVEIALRQVRFSPMMVLDLNLLAPRTSFITFEHSLTAQLTVETTHTGVAGYLSSFVLHNQLVI